MGSLDILGDVMVLGLTVGIIDKVAKEIKKEKKEDGSERGLGFFK